MFSSQLRTLLGNVITEEVSRSCVSQLCESYPAKNIIALCGSPACEKILIINIKQSVLIIMYSSLFLFIISCFLMTLYGCLYVFLMYQCYNTDNMSPCPRFTASICLQEQHQFCSVSMWQLDAISSWQTGQLPAQSCDRSTIQQSAVMFISYM